MAIDNLVSVVIPVYNSEETLEVCIQSVLNQTYQNFEVIIVDDHSTDESFLLANKIRKKDDRIRVIKSKGHGVSNARNSGLKIAKGEFLQFLDSDDYLDSTMLNTLMDHITENNDLVICGFTIVKGKMNEVYQYKSNSFFSSKEFLANLKPFWDAKILNSPCNKLYKTKILKEKEIYFKEKVNFGEDLLFNLEYINASDRISILKDSLYFYVVMSDSSLTRGYRENVLNRNVSFVSSLINFFEKSDHFNSFNKDFVINIFYESFFIILINYIIRGKHEDRNLISGKLKQTMITFKDMKSKYSYLNNHKKLSANFKIMGFLIELQNEVVLRLYFYILYFIGRMVK